MTFPIPCRACGHVNPTKLTQVGQDIACGGCGVAMRVPAPKETARPAGDPPPVVKFVCPACGRKFSTKADMAGKKIRCSGCGAGVRVPGGDARPASQPATPAAQVAGARHVASPPPPVPPASPVAVSAMDLGLPNSLFDDEEDEESSDPYALAGDDGHDLAEPAEPVLPTRAEMLDSARQKAAERAQDLDDPEAEPKPKKKKKRKKKTGYFDPKDTLILVGCVSGFVAVLALCAWAFPGIRFPLGGLLCVVGFIVYLIGAYSLRNLVAEEGFVQLMLFRFFPPYQWWFVVTRWSEAKDFVAFFASGLMILAIGGAVLKTSDIGKKAAAADAAYEKAHGADGIEVVPLSGDEDEEE